MIRLSIFFTFSIGVLSLNAQTIISWSNPMDVAAKSFGHDYPRMSADENGTIHMVWGDGNAVYYSKSNAQGFDPPIRINNDTTQAYIANWTGPDIAVKGNRVYATFMHEDWGRKTYIVSSEDGGNTFGPPTLIETYKDSTSRFPTVTIDDTGHPIVAIMKMTLHGEDPHYVVRRSNDFGNTFTTESVAGNWSGPVSEACDCCPASIKNEGDDVVLFYRDNLQNVRDIWVGVSRNNGNSFDGGFAVDNNKWIIQSCPSSGPDGILLDGKIYSVFLSTSTCYFSTSDLNTQKLESIQPLGEQPKQGSQNFPRIAHHGAKAAAAWRASNNGRKLLVSYTDDLTASDGSVHDTAYLSSFNVVDIAVTEDAIHLIWDDSGSGSLKYMKGSFMPSANASVHLEKAQIYPNPVGDNLYISSGSRINLVRIHDAHGRCVQTHLQPDASIDVAGLQSGLYFLWVEHADGTGSRTHFVKN